MGENSAGNSGDGSTASCTDGAGKEGSEKLCGDGGDVEDEDEEEIGFCVGKESGGIASKMRQLFKMGKAGAQAQLVLMDMPNNGRYHVHKGAVNEDSIKELIQSFKSKTLTMSSMNADNDSDEEE